MILAITPQQARVVNNCACYFTISRSPLLADALRLHRPGRVKGHPFAANDVGASDHNLHAPQPTSQEQHNHG